MSEKIKFLFYTELWANARIESVIMSLFWNFDLSKTRVDIMASQNLSDFYDEEIKRLGSRKIITLTEKYSNLARCLVANQRACKASVEENHYDVVCAMVYVRIARKCGIPVVAFHSQS